MTKHRLVARLTALLCIALPCLQAPAQTLSFPSQPLYLSTAAKPNILMAIDNSGSTDFEVSFNASGGQLWWNRGTSSPCTTVGFTGCGSSGASNVARAGTVNVNTSGAASSTWHGYGYLFPNGSSGSGSRLYTDGSTGIYAAPPLPAYAWTRSATYNSQYFDPTLTYSPWTSGGTGIYANATPTAARSNPASSSSVTFDLTTDKVSNASTATTTGCTAITTAGVADWGFRVQNTMVLPAGTCYRTSTSTGAWTLASSNVTLSGFSSSSGGATYWIRYFPATFYVPAGTVLSGYSSYRSAALLVGKAPDGSNMDGYVIQPGNFTDVAQYNAAIQNFANWYSYYRKRVSALRAGIGSAFSGLTGMNVGVFTINNASGNAWSANVTMRNFDTTTGSPTPKQTFFDTDVYGYATGAWGTPNREAVKFMGSQWRRTDTSAPVQYACQQNFGFLVTDGYSDYGGSLPSASSPVANFDGTYGSPYADTVTGTMADQTMYDYWTPLRSDAGFGGTNAGKVPVAAGCPSTTPTTCNTSSTQSVLDCNSNLHQVFYGMILNATGYTFGVNTTQTACPYSNPPTWPTSSQLSTAYSPAAVDELWHATVNGRGRMFNATRPQDVANKLAAVLADIVSRTSSAASVALNTGSLNIGTQVFQALFSSGDWSGQLLDFPVSTGAGGACPTVAIGNTCPQAWDAGSVLTARVTADGGNDRTILTYNPDTHAGVAFRWNSALGTTNQSLLNWDPTTATIDTQGSARLSWLRGADFISSPAVAAFRRRNGALGDIIDSDPYYVGPPPFNYGFDDYASFREDNYDRTPMVYVGGNDGMLHGFRTSDGRELLAYVPGEVYGTSITSGGITTLNPLLAKLTKPTYTHVYTVNGSPTVGDAYFNSAWHSVLVSGLRSGGQGVFALDVTDPSQFSEANASSLVMWEFTDADDADLGFTYSQPAIVKMANGRWAAIIGNGYNNSAADGNASTTGLGAIFILFLDHTGSTWTRNTDYVKLTVPVGSTGSPNGLATPAAIDLDGDGVADRIYAADLQGDLWRFDVSSSSISNWGLKYGNTPLFIAKDASGNRLPITERPEVGRNLLTTTLPNDVIVYFGTGRYLDSSDNSTANQNTQSFFGIFDKDYGSLPTIQRSNLQVQTITAEVSDNGNSYRVTSQNSIDTSSQYGWYMDLLSPAAGVNQGERQVETPTLRNGRIIFTTLIPPSGACTTDGDSWLMELDAGTGGRTTAAIFDVDQNGTIDSSDTVTSGGADYYGSGVKSTGGIMSRPTILAIDNVLETKLISEANGQIANVSESAGGRLGRITWREMTP